MADTFTIRTTPSLDVPDRALGRAARAFADFTDFWPALAKHLADHAQTAWPLRRQSGKLRTSLRWAGRGLGKGGIYVAKSDELTIGTRVFYSGFSQYGTRHQAKRALLSIDEHDTTRRLDAWARKRATEAGLGVA